MSESDKKISALTGGGAAQAGDEYIIARSGSNYKVTGANVAAAATSLGTLGSLTVSGDLTVDTSTLKVDSANNRVGVGTASPLNQFSVASAMGQTGLNAGTASSPNRGNLWYDTDGSGWKFQIGKWQSSAFTPQMTFQDDGKVGVGTATPAYPAQVYNGQATGYGLAVGNGTSGTAGDFSGLLMHTSGSATAPLYNGAIRMQTTASAPNFQNPAMVFLVQNSGTSGLADLTERARIDSSGNFAVDTNTLYVDAANNRVGVGTASPATPLDVTGIFNGLQARFGNTAGRGLYVSTALNGGTNEGTTILDARGATAGQIVFQTDSTERARITSEGYLKASNDGTYISSTGTYHEARQSNGAAPCFIVSHGSTGLVEDVLQVRANRNTTNNTFYALRYFNEAAAAFKFQVADSGDVTNTNGTYGTISDERLKQDITDAGSQWDDLKAIRFRKYRFISDVEEKGDAAPYLLGVVAQELREVSPGLVDAHPDTEQVEVEVEVEKSRPVLDAEGSPVLGEDGEPLTETYIETEMRTEIRKTGTETLSVKSSILLMKAAVALQEAMARIESLEARVAALEAE